MSFEVGFAAAAGLLTGDSFGYQLALYLQQRRARRQMRALQEQVKAVYERWQRECPCPRCTGRRKREAVLQ